MLGLGSTADFHFHWTDWIASRKRSTAQPVLPEMEKLRGKDILCFYGSDDKDAACKALDPGSAKIIAMGGGHRIGRSFTPIVDAILREVR